MPGQAMTPKLKVTASSQGGVESNRKRTGSPQDDELDSAERDGEPAIPWRSLKPIGHAEVAEKAMSGSPSWLEAECWEVCARQAGRPVVEVTAAGVSVCVVPQGSQAGQGQAEGNRSPSAGEQTLPKARNGRWKSTESKVVPREGRQEGGDVKDRTSDSESAVMAVPEAAKQITSEAAGKRA